VCYPYLHRSVRAGKETLDVLGFGTWDDGLICNFLETIIRYASPANKSGDVGGDTKRLAEAG